MLAAFKTDVEKLSRAVQTIDPTTSLALLQKLKKELLSFDSLPPLNLSKHYQSISK
jgi:hypothetical protein